MFDGDKKIHGNYENCYNCYEIKFIIERIIDNREETIENRE